MAARLPQQQPATVNASAAKSAVSLPAMSGAGRFRYCTAHEPPKRQHFDDRRESACKRGYDARWRRFRAGYLREHALCVDCLKEDRVTAASEIHHVLKLTQHPEAKYDERYLMALCKPHHQVRTARGE